MRIKIDVPNREPMFADIPTADYADLRVYGEELGGVVSILTDDGEWESVE